MSETKLYRVRVTYDTVIAANSEYEALNCVKYGMGEIDDTPDTVFASPILTLNDLPNKWGENYLPWGNIAERTIGQILKENE